MKTVDKLDVDFNLVDNSWKIPGFYGHKITRYSNFRFDVPEDPKFFTTPADITISDDASEKDKTFWDNNRPEKLTKQEQSIYTMIDSIKAVPIFKTYKNVLYTLFTGYLKWKYVEFGPYYKIYSFNQVEGTRWRLGVRTTHDFSTKLKLDYYMAYGTVDQTFKYGGGFIYMFSKIPRRDLTATYKYDVEQLGASQTSFSSDNLFSSVFYRGTNDKLTMVREYTIAYEHEWFTGLINRLHLVHRELFPLGSTEFIIFPETHAEPLFLNSIFTSEIQFDTRLSFHERFISSAFSRATLSSDYPIIQLSYIYGAPGIFKSDYEYHKLILYVSQWFNFASIGWSKYNIEAGKIWGTLPYPLLRIHDGNQSFFFDETAANLMNYYEFVSDAWISASYTHHFSGFLFNKVPLFRKLKWREVAHIKGVFGTLAEKNAAYSAFPGSLRSFNHEPYWEAGAGIENIFKVFRIDAIWRMSHLHDPGTTHTPGFGIFASVFFSF